MEQIGFASLLADRTLTGAKVALVCGDRLLTYRRDDFDHIPDPDLWDLPGGLRERGETIAECARREVMEEFAITLPEECFDHAARFVKFEPYRIEAVFLVGKVTREQVDSIVFGEEGQCWEMIAVSEFIDHPRAVKVLQNCVAVWWDGLQG